MVDAGLSAAEASKRFYAVDRYGLLVEGMADIRPAQVLFVQINRMLLTGCVPLQMGLACWMWSPMPSLLY